MDIAKFETFFSSEKSYVTKRNFNAQILFCFLQSEFYGGELTFYDDLKVEAGHKIRLLGYLNPNDAGTYSGTPVIEIEGVLLPKVLKIIVSIGTIIDALELESL